MNNKSKAFEANRRAVLAMRNIGIGHQGLVKFCGVMNILAPMNANSYTDPVSAIHGAAEVVAKASMKSAAEETAILAVLENLGIKPGCQTKKCLKRIDYDRLRHSVRKSSDKQKNKRKKIRQTKKGYIDNLSEKEGTQYEAGAF